MPTTPDEYNQAQIANGSLTPARITELVYGWQERHGLTIDGKAGAGQTIPSIDAAIAARRAPPPPPPPAPPIADADDARLRDAGARAVQYALAYFNRNIIDPEMEDYSPLAIGSRVAIDEMLTTVRWTWEVPYNGNPQIAWCIIFVASCWAKAGLDPIWLQSYFASTLRLMTWARYARWDAKSPANVRPAAGPFRLVADCNRDTTTLPFRPRAGDIVIVGRDNDPPEGRHGRRGVGLEPAHRCHVVERGHADPVRRAARPVAARQHLVDLAAAPR